MTGKPRPWEGRASYEQEAAMDRTRSLDPTERYLSAHARRRTRQRGIPPTVALLVHEWADMEVPVGGGLTALTLSLQAANEARREGIRPHLLDRARRICCLTAEDGSVVTLLHPTRRRARRYTKRGGR
jgi:hypothetical protein